jgi:hypothetical protein
VSGGRIGTTNPALQGFICRNGSGAFSGLASRFKDCERSLLFNLLHWFLIFRRFLGLAQRGTREMARNRLGPAALALQVCSPHDGCDKKRRVTHENGYNIIGGG